MQDNEKILKFKNATGNVIKKLRKTKTNLSINKLSAEYDFDKGNISKIERGKYNIHLITAWKISEAMGISFVEFAKNLQDELGKDFKFIDE